MTDSPTARCLGVLSLRRSATALRSWRQHCRTSPTSAHLARTVRAPHFTALSLPFHWPFAICLIAV